MEFKFGIEFINALKDIKDAILGKDSSGGGNSGGTGEVNTYTYTDKPVGVVKCTGTPNERGGRDYSFDDKIYTIEEFASFDIPTLIEKELICPSDKIIFALLLYNNIDDLNAPNCSLIYSESEINYNNSIYVQITPNPVYPYKGTGFDYIQWCIIELNGKQYYALIYDVDNYIDVNCQIISDPNVVNTQ